MIVKTITDDYYFWNWLKKSGSYNNNFTLEGAKAVQAYMDKYSEQTESGTIEFDPIAWCVEFSEYESPIDAYNDYTGGTESVTTEQALQYLEDRTTVIELDSGAVIVREF